MVNGAKILKITLIGEDQKIFKWMDSIVVHSNFEVKAVKNDGVFKMKKI